MNFSKSINFYLALKVSETYDFLMISGRRGGGAGGEVNWFAEISLILEAKIGKDPFY